MGSSWEGGDRFSLLFLEEKEYYFKDYTCHYYPTGTGHRVAGHLKICSHSLFFVPRNLHEPIFRVSFANTTNVERCEISTPIAGKQTGDEYFAMHSTERTDMKIGNRNVPYVRHRGDFQFRFSFVYTSLSAVLPRIQQLYAIYNLPIDNRSGPLQQIVREHEESVRFNTGWFTDEDEDLVLELVGNRITPLVVHPGRAVITARRLYFQPFNVVSSSPILTYQLETVISVMKRSINLEKTGVEVFFSERDSVYLTFRSTEERELFHGTLLQQPGLQLQRMRSKERWTGDWVAGRISNYDYLMHLNREADRSFNDLTQYPVFPWVIKDYTSTRLDLNNPATFRDLSKPIGALNAERLQVFKERYEEMKEVWEETGADDSDNPMAQRPFLYGFHYSTPGYVVYYLLRKDPQLMLRLQNGRFDMPDRLMHSLSETFDGVMNQPNDLKELIPEFYSMSTAFLVNNEGLDFGVRQRGDRVDDVQLPPWAKDAHDFVHKLREALECPYVSKRLPQWIDLVFGAKQRGRAAEVADNTFHHLTYDDQGLRALDAAIDPELRGAILTQMKEFGRTPAQLFTAPHPKRGLAAGGGFCPCMPGRAPPPMADEEPLAFRAAPAAMGADEVHAKVVKVARGKGSVARDAVAWLERAADAGGDPSVLRLREYQEVIPLVELARSPAPEAAPRAARALRALATCPANRALIIGAGALEPVVDVLCGEDQVAVQAAACLITELSEVKDELLSNFNVSALAALVELMHEGTEPVRAASARALGNLARGELNRAHVAQLGGLPPLIALLQPRHTGEVRGAACKAIGVLSSDDDIKVQVLDLGGLELVIHMCEAGEAALQLSAIQCLSVFSAHDRLKFEIASQGGLRLLCAAACAAGEELQQAAAGALANLCGDATIINVVVREEGLWSVISMAQSPNPEVQRHAARAFWHLAVHHDNKRQVMDMGGLQSLLKLSRVGERNLQATLLAEEALKKLAEDPAVAAALEREKLLLDEDPHPENTQPKSANVAVGGALEPSGVKVQMVAPTAVGANGHTNGY